MSSITSTSTMTSSTTSSFLPLTKQSSLSYKTPKNYPYFQSNCPLVILLRWLWMWNSMGPIVNSCQKKLMIIKHQIIQTKLTENGVIYIYKHFKTKIGLQNKLKTSFIILSFNSQKFLLEKYFQILLCVKIQHSPYLSLLEKHILRRASFIGQKRFQYKVFKIVSQSTLSITLSKFFGK